MKEQLLAECERMKREIEYHADEYHFWPWLDSPNDAGTCTNGARAIAEKFKGNVFGYQIDWNAAPKTMVAHDCSGHDFAIVGDYLIDWWAWEYDCSLDCPVLHLIDDAAIVAAKYKPRSEWEKVL